VKPTLDTITRIMPEIRGEQRPLRVDPLVGLIPVDQCVDGERVSEIVRAGTRPVAFALKPDLADQLRERCVERAAGQPHIRARSC
jgi:hypothetical protein